MRSLGARMLAITLSLSAGAPPLPSSSSSSSAAGSGGGATGTAASIAESDVTRAAEFAADSPDAPKRGVTTIRQPQYVVDESVRQRNQKRQPGSSSGSIFLTVTH